MISMEDVMTPPNASMTARERARAELTREIKDEAKRQLATAGADGLSLRAVARSLGMVSSALYRYFPSRDDLLTALIIDAYNSLGAAVEEAIAAGCGDDGNVTGGGARGQWAVACRRVRGWAREHPHEYALIYGSPVPGYRAPEATIGPASRVPVAFAGILRDAPGAVSAGAVSGGGQLGGALTEQAAALAAAIAADGLPGVGGDILVRAAIAWTQLFGMVSFELFGQFVGSFEPADAFFEHAVAEMASLVGL
jgi:AcrR family transcriptional regulator